MTQSRFFQSVPHAKALPAKLTSHQMQTVAEEIFELASLAIIPLVESQPKYEGLSQMLGQLSGTIQQLEEAQNHRRYKAVREMRGVGGLNSEDGSEGVATEVSLSQIKRSNATERARQMGHFRRMVSWHLETQSSFADQAAILNRLLEKRLKRFEQLGYEESQPEFKYFFNGIDGNPQALAAIQALNLTEVYGKMKAEHASIKGIYREQTKLESQREKKPKLRESMRDVRHAVRMLLGNMHYDVESGTPVLEQTLAQIDEVIDRAGALGERRETIDEKEAAKAADKKLDQPSDNDTDATDTPVAPAAPAAKDPANTADQNEGALATS